MTNQTEFSHKVEQDVSAQQINDPDSPGQDTDWAEIGQHFWVLGQSLTTALKAAWQNEENRQQVHKLKSTLSQMLGHTTSEVSETSEISPKLGTHPLRTGLQEVVEQVGQAVKEVVESPEFRQARLEVEKAAQPAQAAGQQAFHEIQPYLLTALRQLRSGVDKLISGLEQPATETDEPAMEEVTQ
jgi:uncharacterized membrane protein YccC